MSFLSKIKGMPTIQLGGSPSPINIILGFFFLLAFAVGIYYLYKYVKSARKSGKNNSNNEFNDKGEEGMGKKEAEIMLFYVDWCPHCKTAKPEWEQVKNEYDGRTINGYTVIFTEINCTEESVNVEKLMNTYKIEGYPTIKLLKDGTVIEYDAKPTKDTLIQFLNTVL
jgi:thiol-disulfide isomerase/thioredoxin